MKDTEDKIMDWGVHVIWRVSHIKRECQWDCELHENATSHVYYLLQRITTKTQKSQVKRRPIKPGLKLTITLMYKVTGNCYQGIMYFTFCPKYHSNVYSRSTPGHYWQGRRQGVSHPTNQIELREVEQCLAISFGIYATPAEHKTKHMLP